jgi:hypothetical protein
MLSKVFRYSPGMVNLQYQSSINTGGQEKLGEPLRHLMAIAARFSA